MLIFLFIIYVKENRLKLIWKLLLFKVKKFSFLKENYICGS